MESHKERKIREQQLISLREHSLRETLTASLQARNVRKPSKRPQRIGGPGGKGLADELMGGPDTPPSFLCPPPGHLHSGRKAAICSASWNGPPQLSLERISRLPPGPSSSCVPFMAKRSKEAFTDGEVGSYDLHRLFGYTEVIL